jgi:hypothetical protein
MNGTNSSIRCAGTTVIFAATDSLERSALAWRHVVKMDAVV